MNKYESYQDTDNWYGCIPCSWENRRIKRLFALRDERSYLPLSEVNLISLYSSIGVRQHSDIEHTTGNRARNADGYKIVHRDDIIVNILLCWMGAIGRSDYDGVTSPAYDVYMPRKGVNSQYYHYLFRTTAFSGECYKAGKGIMAMRWRTYSPQFMDITVPVPPRAEQDQIVRFLDWKVSEINKLIRIRRKEIQELEELRSNVIKTTVTSGLDSAASRKYSGESWIGEIPEKWQTLPIKRLFKIYSGATPKSGVRRYWDGNIIWVTPADFKTKDKYVSKGAKTLTDEGLTSCSTSIVPAGSIIFSKRAPVGSVVINSNPLCTNQGCLSCVPYSNASAEFFYYVMSICTDEFERRASGTTFKEISLTEFGKFQMPVPSVDEQKNIASFLDGECSRIDKVISIDEEKIAGLKELKNTIVSDVVTGKIDVRNVTIPEYEHVDDISDDDNEDGEETETDGEEA